FKSNAWSSCDSATALRAIGALLSEPMLFASTSVGDACPLRTAWPFTGSLLMVCSMVNSGTGQFFSRTPCSWVTKPIRQEKGTVEHGQRRAGKNQCHARRHFVGSG